MKIRTLHKKDKPEIMRILENTPEFTPEEIVVAEEVLDDYLEDKEASGFCGLVADMEPGLGGYLIYGTVPMTDRVWELYWLAVDRSYQGQGTGQKIIKTAEDNIWEAGARIIVLETSSKPDYDRTNRFYIQNGYKETGRIKDFYMIGDDQITYEKRRENRLI